MQANNGKSKEYLIMLGPDPKARGGISRVATIWKKEGIFNDYNIKYIPTVPIDGFSKILFLVKNFLKFIFQCSHKCYGVYIHTASRNSFYRKCIFILIAYLFSKKVILHVHPTYFLNFIQSSSGFKRKFIFAVLNRIEFFVVLTKKMKEGLNAIFPSKNIYILKNSINLDSMKDNQNYNRENNKLLYLGWYTRKKGVYDLVDAIEIMNKNGVKIKLEMYGTKEINKLKKYVKEKNLKNIVRVNGWINGEKKIKALYTSTFLILPSYSEGFPNVIIEAMATKTPIIATSVGGLKEVLKDRVNSILIEPGNPLDLSNKITEAILNEDLRKKIVTNAFQITKEKFDIRITKKHFGNIIDKLS